MSYFSFVSRFLNPLYSMTTMISPTQEQDPILLDVSMVISYLGKIFCLSIIIYIGVIK